MPRHTKRRRGIARRRRDSGRCPGSPDTIDFGVSAAHFREQLFEKECWLRRGALRLDPPFTSDDVEQMLSVVEPESPHLQLFHHGQIPEYAFTCWAQNANGNPRRMLDERFRGWLSDGATLVLNRVERLSWRAARMCAEVSAFTGFATLGNAYYSCGGEGSFGAHWDTHDVFVLQLAGRKRWRIFAPTFPLPLPMHTSRESGHTCPPTAALDILLEAGDVLYLPRGFWHNVRPCDGPSLHLSIGVYAPSLIDVLDWLNHRVLAQQECARRTVVDAPTVARELSTLVESLRARLEDPEVLRHMQREFRMRSTGS